MEIGQALVEQDEKIIDSRKENLLYEKANRVAYGFKGAEKKINVLVLTTGVFKKSLLIFKKMAFCEEGKRTNFTTGKIKSDDLENAEIKEVNIGDVQKWDAALTQMALAYCLSVSEGIDNIDDNSGIGYLRFLRELLVNQHRLDFTEPVALGLLSKASGFLESQQIGDEVASEDEKLFISNVNKNIIHMKDKHSKYENDPEFEKVDKDGYKLDILKDALIRIGYKKDFVENNLLKCSEEGQPPVISKENFGSVLTANDNAEKSLRLNYFEKALLYEFLDDKSKGDSALLNLFGTTTKTKEGKTKCTFHVVTEREEKRRLRVDTENNSISNYDAFMFQICNAADKVVDDAFKKTLERRKVLLDRGYNVNELKGIIDLDPKVLSEDKLKELFGTLKDEDKKGCFDVKAGSIDFEKLSDNELCDLFSNFSNKSATIPVRREILDFDTDEKLFKFVCEKAVDNGSSNVKDVFVKCFAGNTSTNVKKDFFLKAVEKVDKGNFGDFLKSFLTVSNKKFLREFCRVFNITYDIDSNASSKVKADNIVQALGNLDDERVVWIKEEIKKCFSEDSGESFAFPVEYFSTLNFSNEEFALCFNGLEDWAKLKLVNLSYSFEKNKDFNKELDFFGETFKSKSREEKIGILKKCPPNLVIGGVPIKAVCFDGLTHEEKCSFLKKVESLDVLPFDDLSSQQKRMLILGNSNEKDDYEKYGKILGARNKFGGDYSEVGLSIEDKVAILNKYSAEDLKPSFIGGLFCDKSHLNLRSLDMDVRIGIFKVMLDGKSSCLAKSFMTILFGDDLCDLREPSKKMEVFWSGFAALGFGGLAAITGPKFIAQCIEVLKSPDVIGFIKNNASGLLNANNLMFVMATIIATACVITAICKAVTSHEQKDINGYTDKGNEPTIKQNKSKVSSVISFYNNDNNWNGDGTRKIEKQQEVLA